MNYCCIFAASKKTYAQKQKKPVKSDNVGPVSATGVHGCANGSGREMLMKFLSNTVAFSLVFAFVSVFPYKLLFRRCSITWPDGVQHRLNTAEHFFTLIYLSCLFILMEFVLLPLDWIPFTKDWAASIGLFVPILLSTWLYKQLYEISWWKSLWRNVFAAMLTISIIIFLLILYFGIYYGVVEVMK